MSSRVSLPCVQNPLPSIQRNVSLNGASGKSFQYSFTFSSSIFISCFSRLLPSAQFDAVSEQRWGGKSCIVYYAVSASLFKCRSAHVAVAVALMPLKFFETSTYFASYSSQTASATVLVSGYRTPLRVAEYPRVWQLRVNCTLDSFPPPPWDAVRHLPNQRMKCNQHLSGAIFKSLAGLRVHPCHVFIAPHNVPKRPTYICKLFIR